MKVNKYLSLHYSLLKECPISCIVAVSEPPFSLLFLDLIHWPCSEMLRKCFPICVLLLVISAVYSQFPTPIPPSRNLPFAPNGIPPSESQFRVVYEWRTIDFAFRTDELRVNALNTQDYIPKNNIVSDVKSFANRLYVSLPRMLPGVPATLG